MKILFSSELNKYIDYLEEWRASDRRSKFFMNSWQKNSILLHASQSIQTGSVRLRR